MKTVIYRLLRKDLIKRLRKKHFGDQFINDVLYALGLHEVKSFYITTVGEVSGKNIIWTRKNIKVMSKKNI